jgi:hypothetical protein
MVGATAAGDTILVHNAYNKIVAAAVFMFSPANSGQNPIRINCVNNVDDSISVGAVFGSTTTLNFSGRGYSYGVQYVAQTTITFNNNSTIWTFESNGPTSLVLNQSDTSGTARTFNIGGGGNNVALIVKNAGINLGGVAHLFSGGYSSRFIWKNGKLTAPNELNTMIYYCCNLEWEDVDFSAMCTGATARTLFSQSSSGYAIFSRCKIPSGAGFTITLGGNLYYALKFLMSHCSSANDTYNFLNIDFLGSTIDETTIVRTNGASDGTTPQSWKMISTSNARDLIEGTVSPPITIWNPDASEKTFTVEGIYDSATNLQNDEVWMELEYPANNTDGLGAMSRTRVDPVTAAADLTASTVAWTTTGITNVNKFKFAVTVTPGKAGPVTAKIYLAKASTTIYIDPMITIS